MYTLILVVSLKAWRKVLHLPSPLRNSAIVEKSVSLTGKPASGSLGFGNSTTNYDEDLGDSMNNEHVLEILVSAFQRT